MKMIIAIIRPEKLEEVQDALDAKQVHLMTASDVRGCGSQRGYIESFHGHLPSELKEFLPPRLN